MIIQSTPAYHVLHASLYMETDMQRVNCSNLLLDMQLIYSVLAALM